MDDDGFTEMASDECIVSNAENRDRKRLLMQMINALGHPDSDIIIQQYFYGRKVKEIAENLDMTSAAVQKRSTRAREKLKNMLVNAGISREAI